MKTEPLTKNKRQDTNKATDFIRFAYLREDVANAVEFLKFRLKQNWKDKDILKYVDEAFPDVVEGAKRKWNQHQ